MPPRPAEPVREVPVRSLGEFIDRAAAAVIPSGPGLARPPLVFRGVENKAWRLATGLDRLMGSEGDEGSARAMEAQLFRHFLQLSPAYLERPPRSKWETLIVGQHHALPTRLLDWTFSPLVAAHFATAEATEGNECVVWSLDWRRLHELFGFPDHPFLVQDLEESSPPGEAGMWERVFEPAPRDEPFALLLEPPTVTHRIATQAGAFTLCSLIGLPLDELLLGHGAAEALTKYVIPPEAVPPVRAQLDVCCIAEGRLFPDLDGIARELRRAYGAAAPPLR